MSILTDRLTYRTIDLDGVDPLSDSRFPLIRDLPVYSQRRCREDEAGNAPLVSYRQYGDMGYWDIVLEYNALPSYLMLVQGLLLRFPQLQEIERVLQGAGQASRNRIRGSTFSDDFARRRVVVV